MIPFEYEGKQYKLLFRYGFDKRGRRTTTAFVCEQGKNMPVLFEGTSICSLDDNFDKETGRQVALEQLIGSAKGEPDLTFPLLSKLRYDAGNQFSKAVNRAYWMSAKRVTCRHILKEKIGKQK
jgi:hypothetical protein